MLLFTAASIASADDASNRAANLIEHEKATIATPAHPTATSQRIEFVGERHTSNGLRQEYEFFIESIWGKVFHCTLDFDFNSCGDITVKGTTANGCALFRLVSSPSAIDFHHQPNYIASILNQNHRPLSHDALRVSVKRGVMPVWAAMAD